MHARIVAGLELWADRISDLLMRDAHEDLEDAFAETLVVMILPMLAVSRWALLHDNDPGSDPSGQG